MSSNALPARAATPTRAAIAPGALGLYSCHILMGSLIQQFCRVGRRWLVAVVLSCLVAASGHAAISDSPITNVEQLYAAADSGQREVASVRMAGTVLWASAMEGRVIFQDDSGIAQLELDVPCEFPRQSARLILEGECAVVMMRGVLKLSDVPTVQNDGLHAAVRRTGSVELKAGRHPIRVAWFNRTDRYTLDVAYQVPGQELKEIPNDVLFRAKVDQVTGATNFVNGLDYRCCEGLWWSLLPNLEHLPAVKSGVVDNFNLAVRSRDQHVGLQFSGFIKVPKDGSYMFSVTSDDGSCLFIGEPSLRIRAVGQVTLPAPFWSGNNAAAPEAAEYQWSEIEGTVNSVNRLGDQLEISLASKYGPVTVKVAEPSDCSFALVPQNQIRAVGVRRNILRLDGTKAPGEFFVQRWGDIEQRYVTPDLWAIHPLLTISNAILASSGEDTQPVVHLRGRVVSGNEAKLYLEDETGRILLEDIGAHTVGRNLSDVLGRLSGEGTNRFLRCGFLREVWSGGSAAGELPTLTTVEQVHQLSREELKRGYPVKLQGVVTTVLQGDAVVIQDATRGIYVSVGNPLPLQVGDLCEVEGTTAPGEFSPFVNASRMKCLGQGTLPNPVQPGWDQLLNGSLHCQYVELEGVVTALETNVVTLLTRDGRIKVQLDSDATGLPLADQNALVRLRGCLFAAWDAAAQRIEVGNIRLNHNWVDVVQLPPLDPFAIPSKTVDDLLRFDPQAGALQRVKVAGQIIHQADAEGFLMNVNKGLRFHYAEEPNAHVGDMVEVVGFPDLSGPSPVLREAVVRRVNQGPLPEAKPLPSDDLLRDEFDSTLVRVEATLLGMNRKPDEVDLELQIGLRRFVAVVKDLNGLDNTLEPGSRVEVIGTYVGQGGNRVLGRPVDSFRLFVNRGFDVRLLSRPPWWTLGRLFAIVGILVGILAAALVWIKMLRRKVEERTVQLEAQILKREQAERQREIEHERARVAHDLHDDLGAGLTEVNMLTSLATSPASSSAEKAHYLDELSGLAGRMVTSLDEIVWAINPRNDTVASLASYFGSYAQRLLELASLRCGLEVAENLPDHPLDPKFRQSLFLAFKEALTNVVQHAGATKVWLRIAIQENRLIVEVSDDGQGFAGDKPHAGADGLANMRDRLSALGGICNIQSKLGGGTTVRLQAPLPGTLP